MTWPPGGTGAPGQGDQGDEPTHRYQGSYPSPFEQGAQPEPTGQPQPYQGSYPSGPYDATQHVAADPTRQFPDAQADPHSAYQPGDPYQPGAYPQSPYQQGAYQPAAPYQQGADPYQQAAYQQPHPPDPGQAYPGQAYPGQAYPGQAYPGQQAYPGGPYPGQQFPGQVKRDRTGLWVALTAVGLVVALGVVVGVILLTRGGDEPTANPPTTSAAPPTSGPEPSSQQPTTTAAPTSSGVKPEPVVPGWQVVVSTKRKLAYDVPPDWTVLDEGTIIGFEDAEGPQVGMSGAAQLGRGFCAESETAYRVGTGFSGYQDTDLALVATDAAGKWGRFGYLGPNDEEPTVEVSEATLTRVAGGDAARAVATVSGIFAQPCVPTTATVHTAAVPSPDGGSYVFVIISDQGVPEGVTNEQADQIISSIRFTG